MHGRPERAAHSSGLCVIFLEILARLLVGCGERLQRGARRAELGRRESSALAACPCRTAAARERLRRRARRAQRMWAWRASWTPATWRRAWRRAARSPTPPRSCSWARAATRRRAPRSARPRPPTAAARLCCYEPPASLGKRCSLADPRVHKSCTLRCGLPSPQLCSPPGQLPLAGLSNLQQYADFFCPAAQRHWRRSSAQVLSCACRAGKLTGAAACGAGGRVQLWRRALGAYPPALATGKSLIALGGCLQSRARHEGALSVRVSAPLACSPCQRLQRRRACV